MKTEVYAQISLSELEYLSTIINNHKYRLKVTISDRDYIIISYNNGFMFVDDIYGDISYLNKTGLPKYKSIFIRGYVNIGESDSKMSFDIVDDNDTMVLVSYPCSGNIKDERILLDDATKSYMCCFIVHNKNVITDDNDNIKVRKYNRYYTMIYEKCVVNPIFIQNKEINKIRLSSIWIESSLLMKYINEYENKNNIIDIDDISLMFKEYDGNNGISHNDEFKISISKKTLKYINNDIIIKTDNDDNIVKISNNGNDIESFESSRFGQDENYIYIYCKYDGRKIKIYNGDRQLSFCEYKRTDFYSGTYKGSGILAFYNNGGEIIDIYDNNMRIAIMDYCDKINSNINDFANREFELSSMNGFMNRFYDIGFN